MNQQLHLHLLIQLYVFGKKNNLINFLKSWPVLASFFFIKNSMNILLRILLGLFLFLVGLYSTLQSEFLEYIFVDAAWSSWFLSPYLSRSFTGSAMALGFLVLFGVGNRQFVYRSSLLLSIGFLLLTILEPTWLGLTRCYGCLAELYKVSRYQGILLWSIASIFAFILLNRGTTPKGWQLPKWSALVFLYSFY